ncbi:hypothetical protein BDF19DRAFT_433859 [Syncephalis fuscata]|nr:hypothetical protein BDF19DRAFT_433859 [Syncephalis fuscata]
MESTTSTIRNDNQIDTTFQLDEERVHENYRLGKAIDNLWLCHTLGHHFLDYYRYGQRRSCTDKWEHVKFCMKLNTMSEETKQVSSLIHYCSIN